MKFSAIYKKGYGAPDASDILEGGLCIDIKNERAYSKSETGNVFPLGLTKEEIIEWLSEQQTIVPIGGIIMYVGQISAIPSGWIICNGSNGTPDLRGKFVYGTNIQSEINQIGGEKTSSIPEHSHKVPTHGHTGKAVSSGAHAHNYWQGEATGGAVEYGNGPKISAFKTGQTAYDGTHEHSLAIDLHPEFNTFSEGTEEEEGNLPPYVKLAYIMRAS